MDGFVLSQSTNDIFIEGSGIEYWKKDCQDILNNHNQGAAWMRFFPTAEKLEDGRIRYSFIQDSKELLSTSRALNDENGGGISRMELDEFQKGLEELLALEETATEPDKKRFLQTLRLPDPVKAPEKYRIYRGGDGKDHLAVLWGSRNADGDDSMAIHPLEAYMERFNSHVKIVLPSIEPIKRFLKVVVCLLALVALCLGGILLFRGDKDYPRKTDIIPPPPPSAQYLTVDPESDAEVGELVQAWASEPGLIAFVGFSSSQVEKEERVNHIYDEIGDYRISWSPKDASLNGEYRIMRVRKRGEDGNLVQPLEPVANLSLSPARIKVGEIVSAHNHSVMPSGWELVSAAVQWGVGGETKEFNPDETVMSYSFDKAGVYSVTLKISAKNAQGELKACESSRMLSVDAKEVEGNEKVNAVLALSPSDGKCGIMETVTAFDCSEGDLSLVVKRTIDWGDNQEVGEFEEHDRSMTHEYKAAGEFPVTLTLELKDGKARMDVKNIVVGDPSLTAVLKVAPDEVEVGKDVVAVDMSEDDVSHGVKERMLSWGDGSKAIVIEKGKEYSHPYSEIGDFEVKLTLRDGKGECVGTAAVVVHVKEASTEPEPEPKLEITPKVVKPGETVTAAEMSVDKEGVVQKRILEWGDMKESSIEMKPGETKTHVYDQANTYQVKLSLVCKDGRRFEKSWPVEVGDNADEIIQDGIAKLEINPSEAFIGQQVVAVDQTNYKALGKTKVIERTLNWENKPEGQSLGLDAKNGEFKHVYEKEGEYDVVLVIKTSDGKAHRAAGKVVIRDYPNPDLRVSPENALEGETVTAEDRTDYAGLDESLVEERTLVWGDDCPPVKLASGNGGNKAGEREHSYKKEGKYTVVLAVKYKAVDKPYTSKRVVTVGKAIGARLTLSESEVCVGQEITAFDESNVSSFAKVTSRKVFWDDRTTDELKDGESSVPHVYGKTGEYTVRLELITEGRAIYYDEKTVVVHDKRPEHVVPRMHLNPKPGIVGKDVVLSDTSVIPAGMTVSERFVSWGERKNEKEPFEAGRKVISHLYPKEGEYKVTLTFKAGGRVYTAEQYLIVENTIDLGVVTDDGILVTFPHVPDTGIPGKLKVKVRVDTSRNPDIVEAWLDGMKAGDLKPFKATGKAAGEALKTTDELEQLKDGDKLKEILFVVEPNCKYLLTGKVRYKLKEEKEIKEKSIKQELRTVLSNPSTLSVAERATFLIMVKFRGENRLSLGSGVAISRDGFILTNAHVVTEGDLDVEQIYVFRSFGTEQGKSVPIQAVLMHKEFNPEPKSHSEIMDLALLKVDMKQFKNWDYLPLEATDIEKGEHVFAYGYPGVVLEDFKEISKKAEEVVHTEGRISVINGNVYIHDCTTFYGNSGGPLVTQDGRLVGINTAINLKEEKNGKVLISNFSISIRSSVARRFYEKYRARIRR